MKTLSLISTSTLCVAMMACSTAAETPMASAGTSAGGASSSAGAAPMGGSAPTAGSGNVAGSGTAGSATAGSTSAGGDSSMGGSAGMSTMSGGSGGTPAMAGAANGGMSGTAGAGMAGGGAIDATMFSGGWDGALLEYPCGSKGSSVDCPQDNSCVKVSGTTKPSSVIPPKLNGQTTKSTWTMGGTMGTIYDVHVLIRGVTEAYNYVGGTIDKTSGTPSTREDLFGSDGKPQPNNDGNNGSDYNSFILTVTPPGGGTAKMYNLNAVQSSENPHTSPLTQHRSFKIVEDKHLKIAGGSTVKLEVGDSNCVEIMNCGDQAGGSCTSPWVIPLTGSMPPIPATGSFDQPFSANGSFGQWVSFDVLDVTVAK